MFKLAQQIIWNWGVRCFGAHHMRDPKVRAIRFLEEATELVQALGVTQEQSSRVVATVYDRPRGDSFQELGGSFVTYLALCTCLGIDPIVALEHEITRCLAKDPKHFAARNEEKNQLGLTGQ